MSLDIYLQVEVDTGGESPHVVILYDANITHNVCSMWEKAGCYDALYESDGKTAGEILPVLREGRNRMEEDLPAYRKMNPANGWGCAESALAWLGELIKACAEHSKAIVRVSR